MPQPSDITVAAERFYPEAVSDKTLRLNDAVRAVAKATPPWWVVGADRHQEMRLRGDTTVVKPVFLPDGRDFSVPSREPGRDIPCRVFLPSNNVKPAGLFLFVHGGGWCFMSESTSDPFLRYYADITSCAAVSVGYRLAPAHPYPAGPDDCLDAARYLLAHAPELYGGPLRYIAGESAGGHLALLTTLHLLDADATFGLSGGLILHFGIFELNGLPSRFNLKDPPALTAEMMQHYTDAFTPNMTEEQRRAPAVSPFYWDLETFRGPGGSSRLPSTLFTCGTADPLVDDTVFMATRWLMAGGEAVMKLYEGAHHGFNGLKSDESEASAKVKEDIEAFVHERLPA